MAHRGEQEPRAAHRKGNLGCFGLHEIAALVPGIEDAAQPLRSLFDRYRSRSKIGDAGDHRPGVLGDPISQARCSRTSGHLIGEATTVTLSIPKP